jgi:hypothetical protein
MGPEPTLTSGAHPPPPDPAIGAFGRLTDVAHFHLPGGRPVLDSHTQCNAGCRQPGSLMRLASAGTGGRQTQLAADDADRLLDPAFAWLILRPGQRAAAAIGDQCRLAATD